MPARKRNTAAAAADSAETTKVLVTLAIEVPTAKWTPAEPAADEATPAKVAEALMAGGFDQATAEAMATKVVAPKVTGPAEVREDVRHYVEAEVAKLPKLTEVGATVELRAPYRPKKK